MFLIIKQLLRIVVLLHFCTVSLGKVFAADNTMTPKQVMKCSGCHGIDGNSKNNIWPNLAGLHEKYIIKQLNDFKSGARKSKEMLLVLKDASLKGNLNLLAEYFSEQTVINNNKRSDFADNSNVNLKLGEQIYKGKRIEYGIPGCEACHGENSLGDKEGKYPRLYGQHRSYIVKQMQLFRSRERSNDNPAMMRNIAMMMDDEDIESVAAYIALMSIQ